MTEMTLHTFDTAPERSRPIMAQVQESLGVVPNLHRTLAESPVALGAYRTLSEIYSGASLSPVERQVVYLAAAHANRCHYCTMPHPEEGLDAEGVARLEQAAAAIRENRRIGDHRLQALRRFTEAAVEDRGWVPQSAVDVFFAAGYTRENLLEVLAGVALVTLASYANHIAATPIDASHLVS